MKRYLIILATFLSFCSVHAQNMDSTDNINNIFKLNLNSIERRLAINKLGTDTSYFLDYSIENVSNDTLVYITNSCFYYNHYLLKAGQQEFNLNAKGDCQLNSLTNHTLAPGDFFNMTESISSADLYLLENGNWNMTLQVPLVKDKSRYQVDGRDHVEHAQYLIFNGEVSIVQILGMKKKKQKGK